MTDELTERQWRATVLFAIGLLVLLHIILNPFQYLMPMIRGSSLSASSYFSWYIIEVGITIIAGLLTTWTVYLTTHKYIGYWWGAIGGD